MTPLETPQRSVEWFEARRGLPTCSRFDQILTPVDGKPAKAQEALINSLIAESICPPKEGFIRGPMTEDMMYGMKLEAEARCAFEFEYSAGLPVTECGFMLHDSGTFGGSPDALVGEVGGVEIKCPLESTQVGYVRAGVLPKEYRCQIHGYLIVSGRQWWDFFSYARHLPHLYLRVHRDDFTAKLEHELHAFVARYNIERAKFDLPPIGAAPDTTPAAP
jgi:hypothetical protein